MIILDYKDFKDGLLSCSLILIIFSLTFLFGSLFLKPYIALTSDARNFIIILSSINLFFCSIYLLKAIRLDRTFKLEDKHIIHFGKLIGIFTLFYTIHFFSFTTLLLINLHNLEMLMTFLIIFVEALLIGLVLKEVYDLLFLEESQRDFALDENRKKYIEREKSPISREDIEF